MNVRSLDKYRKEQEKKQRELKRRQQQRRKQAEALRRSMERPGRPSSRYEQQAMPYGSQEERVWRVPNQPGRGFVEAWPWFAGVFLISLLLGFLLH